MDAVLESKPMQVLYKKLKSSSDLSLLSFPFALPFWDR